MIFYFQWIHAIDFMLALLCHKLSGLSQWDVTKDNKLHYESMEEKIRVILKPDGTGRPGIFWKIPDASVSFNLNSELLKCS